MPIAAPPRRAARLVAASALLVAALGLAAPGQAQTSAAGRQVVRVEVEGNRNVTTDQILNWFALRPGDRFDPGRVSRAVRELTSKRRFADVRVEGEEVADGVVLHIVVQEYPQLQAIELQGVEEIAEKDVRAALKLAPGSFLTPAMLREDRDKIASLYRDKGYYNAAIADTLTGDATRPTLVLRVDEGPKVSVRRVEFVGNEKITSETLRKQIKTREDGWLSGGDLKPDQLQQDLELLASFYRDRGHLDAQVLGHDLEVAPNGKDLTLRIRIQEGPLYTTGDVTWTGNTVFTNEQIAERIKLRKGTPFGEADYDATTSAIYELYNDAGYIHFNATPRRDAHDHVVNVTYSFTEGSPAKIHHIRIVGNTKTQDKVILREMLLFPGDTFDRSKLMRSIREIYALGFFEDVGIQNFTPRSDGSVDLELRVAEKQTGQLGAGAGYSGVNGVTGFVEVANTNFLGTGKRVSFRSEFGRYNTMFDFGYSQEWLYDTPTSMGIQLYHASRKATVNAYYRDLRTGGSLTLGRRLDFIDYTRVSWRFRAESVRLEDFSPVYVGPLRNKNYPIRTMSTGLTLRRDSTDNPFFPSNGSSGELSFDLTGGPLPGDESYVRGIASLAWFQRVGISRLTLMVRPRVGLLHGLEGRPTPEYETWRLGGNRLYAVRGYEDYEIVPIGNLPYIGGQAMALFTAELRYPFTPKVQGVVFFDAGNTWNTFKEADPSFLRKGAGFGIRVEVPMLGNLGLDYGYGFNRLDVTGRPVRGDWQLHFNFGPMF